MEPSRPPHPHIQCRMASASAAVFNAEMGIWGAGPLDNDDAMDFVDGLLGLSPGDAVQRLLEAVEAVEAVDAVEPVEAVETAEPTPGTPPALNRSQGVSALAAVAVLVNVSLPERLRAWRAALPVTVTPAFAGVMREAIERVLSVDSELAVLWAEAGKGREFAGGVAPVVEVVTAMGVDPRQPTLF